MNAFLVLAALPTMLVSARADLQVDLKDTTRIGNSYTPQQPGSTGNDYNFSDIVTPGAQITARWAGHQKLFLRYAPNFLYIQQLQVPGGDPTTPLSILHRAQFTYDAGTPHTLAFYSTVNLLTGTLELAALSSVAGADASLGTNAVAPVNQRTDYFGINGFIAFEKDFGHTWKFTNMEVVAISRSTSESIPTGGPTVNQATALTSLVPTNMYLSRNELSMRVSTRNFLLFDLQLSDVNFLDTNEYWGVLPAIGWQWAPRELTNLRMRLGALLFLQQQPQEPDFYSNLWYIDFVAHHTFVKIPKLHIDIAASLQPYYDQNFGTLEPRAMIYGLFSYNLTPKVTVQMSLRGLSGEYWTFSGWQPVLPDRTRYMAIGNVSLSVQLAKWIQFNIGMYADDRTFEATPGELREYYGRVGFKGTWTTGVGAAPDEEPPGSAPKAFSTSYIRM